MTQIGRKLLGGHHTCLGDIVRNIGKMGVFCSFSEGSLGRVLQKFALIEQISIFPINFTAVGFLLMVRPSRYTSLSRWISAYGKVQ